MLQNNLIEFSKTAQKPLFKTLNILKSSTDVKEFFHIKKLDILTVDMLTRSFYFHYMANKKFEDTELEILESFIENEFKANYYFFVTKMVLSHLKRIRFDSHYVKELNLFKNLKIIIQNMPENTWISIENICKFSIYRELDFHLEYKLKTDMYYLDSGDKCYYCKNHYDELFLRPLLKGSFFYLSSLGLFEIKYDDPKSTSYIKDKGKEYVSLWDGLRYIKLTDLGRYIFGFTKEYKKKEIKKIDSNMKFDEYKPVISIAKSDTIAQAKLEPYTEKYDDTKYILNYSKIFRDCKNSKALELKIDNFYKYIEPNPPKIFKNFFDEIKQNQNLLEKDIKIVVIKLKENKKLLNFFMKNKKLQELIVKAQGYKILVLQKNIAKVSKILKENGFFVEF
jgi:hypothetical protein